LQCLRLFIAQKLREIVNAKLASLGATSAGADWCLKALHPSDPITEVRGIPDESAVPSMFMNYQAVYTISPAVNATGTWSLDGQLIPNPFSFGCATYTDSTGYAMREFVNPQIEGAMHSNRLAEFLSAFSRWRLAYGGLTIVQDGPDLANQGTVVACQKPVEPPRFNCFHDNFGSNANGAPATGWHHAFHLETKDLPSYQTSQAMPNAYFGKSKEGLYMPLKLTKTHQTWHSHRDLTYQATAASLAPYTNELTGGALAVPVSSNQFAYGQYPFPSVNDLHAFQMPSPPQITLVGQLTSDFCNENWGDFSFRNLAVTTSLSFFFRMGFEMQLQPGSMLAPHLKLSPPSDEVAVRNYFMVSRELKDAYPAEYNDLGQIWDVISGVLKTASPFLNLVPVAGPVLSTVASGVSSVGDRVREATRRVTKPTIGNVASAADIEAIRAAPLTRVAANAGSAAPVTYPWPASVPAPRKKRVRRRRIRTVVTRRAV
jgi:hypothetical protein